MRKIVPYSLNRGEGGGEGESNGCDILHHYPEVGRAPTPDWTAAWEPLSLCKLAFRVMEGLREGAFVAQPSCGNNPP
jgi:hypothetical protein